MKNKWTRGIFIALLVALFLEIFLGFPISLEKKPDEAADETEVAAQAEQVMQGVHLVESQKGSRDWELFSSQAEGAGGKGVWQIKTVRVLFYNNEQADFTVTGERGEINNETKDMKIEGKVVLKSSNGYVFKSESITYAAKTRMIRSPGRVEMQGPADQRGPGLKLFGQSMFADVDQSLMKIENKVTASKAFNNGRKFQIESDAAEFSGKNKSAKFSGKVVVQVDTMRLEGPSAQFDYASDQEFLKSIMVQGGVKVTDVDKYATSDSVSFDPLKNSFVLSGRPRVVQNNDELMGDQIVFIDGGKKVKVENIKAKVERK